MLIFQWDPKKSESNWKKHGVSFDEAASVFFDEHMLVIDDPVHSAAEVRYFAIGRSEADRVLTLVFTYRSSKNHEKEIYRIISARTASKAERKAYAEASSAER